MTKKIHTIQSSDKVEFDKQVNFFLELGGELMDGGYKVINNHDGVVYSQVVVFNDNYIIKFYKNGELSSVEKNKNDDGFWILWYENGQKSLECRYKDGEIDGLRTRWYENGQKDQECSYKNGTFDGVNTSWFNNGQKREEVTWKDGKIDGLWIKWYVNGQKRSEHTYKNSEPVGLWIKWYVNGQKRFEGNYKDGEMISLKKWYKDGSVKE